MQTQVGWSWKEKRWKWSVEAMEGNNADAHDRGCPWAEPTWDSPLCLRTTTLPKICSKDMI